MAHGIWRKMSFNLERMADAGRELNGIEIVLKRQTKLYSEHYWTDCFASPSFVKKELPAIDAALVKGRDAMASVESIFSQTLSEMESEIHVEIQKAALATARAGGPEGKELKKLFGTWAARSYADFSMAKATRNEIAKALKMAAKSKSKKIGKNSLAALSELSETMTSFVREIIPLRKTRRAAATSKQYGILLLEDFAAIKKSVSAYKVSDPADVHEPGYVSLTRAMSQGEKDACDDWKDSVIKFAKDIWSLRTDLADTVKREELEESSADRRKIRQEYKELEDIDEDADAPPKKRVKSPERAQQLAKEFEEKKLKKERLKNIIKSDELRKFDDDIDLIKGVGAKTKLLNGKDKFGFVKAGVVATNSYVSDPTGVEHLKRHKIKWQWVAKSYILFKNVVLFGWRTALESKEGFDPVALLRRIKRRSPSSEWTKHDFHFWSSRYVKRDGYSYAFLLPALKTSSVGLGDDRDITIRNWDIATDEVAAVSNSAPSKKISR